MVQHTNQPMYQLYGIAFSSDIKAKNVIYGDKKEALDKVGLG
jgi:hypothetical protein